MGMGKRDEVDDDEERRRVVNGRLLIWTKVFIVLDMLAVSFVIPLMNAYFKDAGLGTIGLGYMSSVYNVAQIVGTLFVGGLMSDMCSKRDVLLLSFVGSAVSYLLLGTTSSLPLLFFSRALVGAVKQTFSVSYSIINEATEGDPEQRSLELGRIYALSNACWTVGPSLGGMLYKVDRAAPSVAAAALFLLNALLLVAFVPKQGIMASPTPRKPTEDVDGDSNNGKDKPTSVLWAPFVLFSRQFSALAHERGVLNVIALRILIIFTESSMSSTRLVNYYQTRFGIQTSQLGFVSTISNVVGILIQSFLVNRVIAYFGGNSSMIIVALVAMAGTHFLESAAPTYMVFAFTSLLPAQIAGSLMSASIRNLFSNVVPSAHFGKAQAVFNMCISLSGIISPIYGSRVFSVLSTEQYHWKGVIAGVHLLLLSAAVAYLIPTAVVPAPTTTRAVGATAAAAAAPEKAGGKEVSVVSDETEVFSRERSRSDDDYDTSKGVGVGVGPTVVAQLERDEDVDEEEDDSHQKDAARRQDAVDGLRQRRAAPLS